MDGGDDGGEQLPVAGGAGSGPQRARATLVALSLVVVAVLLGQQAIGWLVPGPRRTVTLARQSPPAHPSVREGLVSVLCVEQQDDPDYCRRHAADVVRRLRLSESERAALDPARDTLRRAFPARPPQGWTPDGVRRVLVAAGYPQPQVRTARRDDPAVAGSVLYGVDSGPGCLTGWLATGADGAFSSGPDVVGALPGGNCLAP